MRYGKAFLLGLFTLGFSLPIWAHPVVPGDSIGLKELNGKKYVLHKVDPGDNLTKIAKRYGSSVTAIQEANAMTSTNVNVGQVIMVPKVASAPLVNPPLTPAPPKNGTHTVAAGETLFSISKMYGIPVENIKSWNSLGDSPLAVGQTLRLTPLLATPAHVDPEGTIHAQPNHPQPPLPSMVRPEFHTVQPGESLWGIARKYAMDVTEIKRLNKLENDAVAVGQKLVLKGDAAPNDAHTQPHVPAESLATALSEASPSRDSVDSEVLEEEITLSHAPIKLSPTAKTSPYLEKRNGKSYLKVEEMGLAAAIEDFSTDQTRFYAFHKYLPQGSYVRVDYPAKKQSILVEIIGQLPESDPNVIRLTARARDYLMLKKSGDNVVVRYVVPK